MVLIDRTCSGADIAPGGKPPIVGTVGSAAPDPTSQVADATARLAAAGLQPSDVDLVTVGMGGNDAKFGEIVSACLLPNMIRELLRQYPDPPREIELISGYVTCERLDDRIFHTDPAINTLAPKETWAQGQILSAFPSARLLQVNYPSILPAQKKAPATCGGIRKGDIDFARNKISKIDKVIGQTVQSSASTSNGRIGLVDVEASFGENALCPSNAAAALANGINQANFQAELRRLLNADGKGDAEARGRLDTLVDDYNEWTHCALVHYVPFGEDCNVSAAFDRMKASAFAVVDYLGRNDIQRGIFANLMAPPGSTTESVDVRFDRSRGLFHPNAQGQVVMACRVLDVFGPGGCPNARSLSGAASLPDTLNGTPVTNAPIDTWPGSAAALSFGGFAPGSTVALSLHSQPVDLGTATADANGVVTTTITMPPASPGVHTLELQGTAADGVDRTDQALVKYPGPAPGW